MLYNHFKYISFIILAYLLLSIPFLVYSKDLLYKEMSLYTIGMYKEMTLKYAYQIKDKVGDIVHLSSTIKKSLKLLMDKEIKNRWEVSEYLYHILEETDNIRCTWVWFVKNGFDNDDKYIGYSAYPDNGQFFVSWVKTDNNYIIRTLDLIEDNKEIKENPEYDLYRTIPLETGLDYIDNPGKYSYNGFIPSAPIIVTISTPIKKNDSIVGVVGVDIDIKQFNIIDSNIISYYINGIFLLITDGNYIIDISSKDEEYITKPLIEIFSERDIQIINNLKNKRPFGETKEYLDVLKQYCYIELIPIEFENNAATWYIIAAAPINEINDRAYNIILGILIMWAITIITFPLVTVYYFKKVGDYVNNLKRN